LAAAVWVGPYYTEARCTEFYIPLLEKGFLELDNFLGCDDWVFSLISQISMLEGESFSTTTCLDSEQFSNETVNLDQKLNTGLQRILDRRCALPLGVGRDVTFVTEMWTHAALVHLHVVAKGPRSTHPTLRTYVARGLEAYINLPRRLDIHCAMPFGVLASMANDREADMFMRVADSPRSLKEINPGQRKTFRTVKECWRLRKLVEESSPEKGVSWRDGAASLGLVLLPV
jgi:hypothetical protein